MVRGSVVATEMDRAYWQQLLYVLRQHAVEEAFVALLQVYKIVVPASANSHPITAASNVGKDSNDSTEGSTRGLHAEPLFPQVVAAEMRTFLRRWFCRGR